MKVPCQFPHIDGSSGIHEYNIPCRTTFTLQYITDDTGILLCIASSEICSLGRCNSIGIAPDCVRTNSSIIELRDYCVSCCGDLVKPGSVHHHCPRKPQHPEYISQCTGKFW